MCSARAFVHLCIFCRRCTPVLVLVGLVVVGLAHGVVVVGLALG